MRRVSLNLESHAVEPNSNQHLEMSCETSSQGLLLFVKDTTLLFAASLLQRVSWHGCTTSARVGPRRLAGYKSNHHHRFP